MKVALVAERLNVMAGAEKHLLALADVFPDAPIYTALYTPHTMPEDFRRKDIRVSFAQRVPGAAKYHQRFLPVFMLAFEQFDLSEFDVVISINHACAKSVITRPKTLHVCICCSPMRYAWDMYHDYLRDSGKGRIFKSIAALTMAHARNWDVRTANGVDKFVAISRHVASRIRKYYRRDSVVIYPPVECDRFVISDKQDDYFLMVSRLAPYKKVDLAVEAFNRLGLPLLVIGEGEQQSRLKAIAGNNIRFLKGQTDQEVAEAYQRCRAFVFPGEEDFGITPVEAQAAGRPVIAFARGGATETVKDGVSGVFFQEQTVESLMDAVRRFEATEFDPVAVRANAMTFDRSVFMTSIARFVEDSYRDHVSRL
ncbi:MAG: glycosyltransferase [Armatimonadetes bacterium]|nr:glycosyltransferase [Armatimonadota bacterium]